MPITNINSIPKWTFKWWFHFFLGDIWKVKTWSLLPKYKSLQRTLVKKFERRSCQKRKEKKEVNFVEKFFKASYFFVLLRWFCRNFFCPFVALFVETFVFVEHFLSKLFCVGRSKKNVWREIFVRRSCSSFFPSFCFCVCFIILYLLFVVCCCLFYILWYLFVLGKK